MLVSALVWRIASRQRRPGASILTRYWRPADTRGPRRQTPRAGLERQLFRLEAIGRELVAVEIADIAGIGVRLPAARSGGTLVLAAGGERRLMECVDRGAVRRDK